MPDDNSNLPEDTRPVGRPTKFSDNLQSKIVELISRGFIDEQICEIVDISISTLAHWRRTNPDFKMAIKEAKLLVDLKVEQALFQRATGWVGKEVKTVYDKDSGQWQTNEVVKHYPPDPVSMIFWLKNRQPDQWREKSDVIHSGSVAGPLVQILLPTNGREAIEINGEPNQLLAAAKPSQTVIEHDATQLPANTTKDK